MPLFWQYLLKEYFKILLLAAAGFLAVLFVTRLDQVATILAMGASLAQVSAFVLYQLLFLLPVAVPVSALVATMILFQRLSNSQELTALRSGGFSLRQITAPILLAATLLSLLNFYLVSELATLSHLASRHIRNELSNINPLRLMQNYQLLKLQDVVVEMQLQDAGRAAHDVLIIFDDRSRERLDLLTIRHLNYEPPLLHAEEMSLISSSPSESTQFDHLLIENQKRAITPANEFTNLIRKTHWRLSNDHLQLHLLLERCKELHLSKNSSAPKALNSCYSEIARRLSLSLAVFSFTLIGIAFGTHIGRHRSRKAILRVTSLAAFFLVCFFAAKSFDQTLWLSLSLHILAHSLILILSLRMLHRITLGVER